MSADNWAICPQCKATNAAILERQEQGLASEYGKIPAQDWLERRKALDAARSLSNTDPTLREDYGFHMSEDGEFTAVYYASCRECGFKHTFKHKQQLETKHA